MGAQTNSLTRAYRFLRGHAHPYSPNAIIKANFYFSVCANNLEKTFMLIEGGAVMVAGDYSPPFKSIQIA